MPASNPATFQTFDRNHIGTSARRRFHFKDDKQLLVFKKIKRYMHYIDIYMSGSKIVVPAIVCYLQLAGQLMNNTLRNGFVD